MGDLGLDRLLGWVGYPAAADTSEANRLERAVLRAVGETMYPGGEGWPSYEDARVIETIDDYLRRLTPHKRRLVLCLFTFTELAALLRPPFRRFSRLGVPRRKAMLNAWDGGRIRFLHECAASLRRLLNLAYLSDEAVVRRTGETHEAACREAVNPRETVRDEAILELPALRGRKIRETADFVIVGSGPGGSVLAHELAEKGHSVIVLERGPFYRPEEHPPSTINLLGRLFYEQGLRVTRGNIPVHTFQAHALGGTSVVNSAICWRAPEWLFDHWRDTFGVEGMNRATLDPHYEKAERMASVTPTEEPVWGEKGRLFKQACEAVGVEGRPIRRATKGCRGCSECFHGCLAGAKQSMDRCYIPAATRHGARFYTSVRAEDLIWQGGRVAGVRGYVLDEDGKRCGEVEVRAGATVLAAGVMASPMILFRNPQIPVSPALGHNLRFHVGIGVSGIFDHDVNPWIGGTQCWDTENWLREGIHMEVLWVPVAMLSARTTGFGDNLRQTLEELRRTAVWCVGTRIGAVGRLTPGSGWEPNLRLDLREEDGRLLKRGMDLLVEHFFSVGAAKVRPGLQGYPSELKTRADVQALKNYVPTLQQFVLGGNHVYGTCSMGSDPTRSVVDSTGAVHGVPDLYVCDTSVFPSPSAVNPQLTLMALASRFGELLDRRYS